MEQNPKILVLNPGSTSTKIALYAGSECLFTETVRHDEKELFAYLRIPDQLPFRMKSVHEALTKHNSELSPLRAVVARGGLLPPVCAGAYLVTHEMTEFFRRNLGEPHASNLGCLMAEELSHEYAVPAYVYDGTSVDQLSDVARVSGLPELPRVSRGHVLNTRAMARKCAEEELKKPFEDCTIIVAHLGGGCTVWLIRNGRNEDLYTDDDGPMAPERSGVVQATAFIQKYFREGYSPEALIRMIRGGSGLKAHLGTSDLMAVEEKIRGGDAHAALIYDALAYQIAKCIGGLAAAASGNIDRIILTGGAAHSKMLTDKIIGRVGFLAPISLMAGEHEMEALASGCLRVLNGEEEAREFHYRFEE